jgi:hypothetical protein
MPGYVRKLTDVRIGAVVFYTRANEGCPLLRQREPAEAGNVATEYRSLRELGETQVTIFEQLRANHRRQRQLADDILEGPVRAGYGGRQFSLLCDELEAHAAAGEHTFYADLLALSGSQAAARRAVLAYDEAAAMMAEIAEMSAGSAEWRAAVQQFSQLLSHRIAEEEEDLALARLLIDDDQAVQLGERYLSAKARWIDSFGRIPLPCPVLPTAAAATAVPERARDRVTVSRWVAAVVPGRTRAWLRRLGRPLQNVRRHGVSDDSASLRRWQGAGHGPARP